MRALMGFLVGVVFAASPLWAYRTETPPTLFPEWDSNNSTQLNNILLQISNVLNGGYQMNVTTTDPDGSRKGDAGQEVLWLKDGAATVCVNTDNATDWDCWAATD